MQLCVAIISTRNIHRPLAAYFYNVQFCSGIFCVTPTVSSEVVEGTTYRHYIVRPAKYDGPEGQLDKRSGKYPATFDHQETILAVSRGSHIMMLERPKRYFTFD